MVDNADEKELLRRQRYHDHVWQTINRAKTNPECTATNYLAIGMCLVQGIQGLRRDPFGMEHFFMATYIAAPCYEVLLKAVVTHAHGTDKAVRKPAVRHSLKSLQNLATELGLEWMPQIGQANFELLDALHSPPGFLLRYWNGADFLPTFDSAELEADLSALLAEVKERVPM